jgi:predicted nuclease of restriction endonuclease-like (RecB) superfamily
VRRAQTGDQRGRYAPKLVKRLAADLAVEFPGMGVSEGNLRSMGRFADAYPDERVLDGPAGSVPWGHHLDIIGRVKDSQARQFYLERAAGWSRRVLQHHIATALHVAQGAALSSFDRALDTEDAVAAQSITRDPLLLDFVAGEEIASERDLERALIGEIKVFMLALGRGFMFAGRQYPIRVGEREFFIDLLFYHHGQRRFVVLELKVGDFDAAFAGQINLYVNAIDERVAHPDDKPTIGIILCASRDETVTRLTLHGIQAPIAVATYRLGEGTTERDSFPTGISPRTREELEEIKAVEEDLRRFATRKVRELAAARERPDDELETT